jgi:hypothetical protein
VTPVRAAPLRRAGTAWLHAAAIAAAFLALAALTWQGWADVLMDFGRELYAAWRLCEGDVLYREVASFYGPLSPYVNAFWFALFGPGVRTLTGANLALLALTTAMLWSLARRGAAGGRLGPTVAAIAFLALCAFAQRTPSSSFNFVAPYSHEATHGFMLAVAAVLAALRFGSTARARWAALAGALAGLAFLTKPESFVAAFGASAACLGMALVRPATRSLAARATTAYAAGLLLPPSVAFALLCLGLPAGAAWTALRGSWVYLGRPELTALPYFAWSMGTDDVPQNLKTIAGAAGLQMLVLGPALAAAARLGRGTRRAPYAAAAIALAVAVWLGVNREAVAWIHVARPLPLWSAGAAIASAFSAWQARDDEAAFQRQASRMGLAMLALLFLPRMLLHGRLYHYGFVLAAAGVVLVAMVLVDWIPSALERRGRAGLVFRVAALTAFGLLIAHDVRLTWSWMQHKQWIVGEGADRLRADVRGAYVNATLEAVPRILPPNGRLVVLPEGVMINYLLRRRSSIPYVTMLPSDLATFGEAAFLDALGRDPPEVILLVHRDTSEYGRRFFGTDYGLPVAAWIAKHYAPAGRAGDIPLRASSRMGIAAMRWRGTTP